MSPVLALWLTLISSNYSVSNIHCIFMVPKVFEPLKFYCIYMYDYLQVYNFLPSISAAIGGFTPQRYVWRICIALHAGLRFLLVGCYYTWLSSINMGVQKTRYQQLVKVAILCHTIENLALVTLTCVSSTENFGKIFLEYHISSVILLVFFPFQRQSQNCRSILQEES